jgi:hypothetical protein
VTVQTADQLAACTEFSSTRSCKFSARCSDYNSVTIIRTDDILHSAYADLRLVPFCSATRSRVWEGRKEVVVNAIAIYAFDEYQEEGRPNDMSMQKSVYENFRAKRWVLC